jgi:flagellar basal body rod protein FlgC
MNTNTKAARKSQLEQQIRETEHKLTSLRAELNQINAEAEVHDKDNQGMGEAYEPAKKAAQAAMMVKVSDLTELKSMVNISSGLE